MCRDKFALLKRTESPSTWKCRVLRRYHVESDPINFVDPYGLIVETPSDYVTWQLSLYYFLTEPGLLTGASLAYDSVALGTPFLPGGAGYVQGGGKVAKGICKISGRTGKQQKLKSLLTDKNVSKSDKGWIKQDINSIERGQRSKIRVPPTKQLAHRRGKEAKQGYGYEHSDLQDIDLHKLQHKVEGY
ncbi:MAG: hypothetical protein H6754_06265 [Candidatus Omnitrophica bacterium]|nr:hypothetical protein [Candidatus Omnitrophota bacterium]